ncbi:MAG TPA: hypothetical protein VH518_18700 [Tepidisphaeraceae bacterium]|jgi:hypothetical protein
MTRPTVVYVSMLVLFGAGLWAIISAGSILLRAPTDLSGQWELRPADAAPAAEPVPMLVEQSGIHFRIKVGDKAQSLTLTSDRIDPANKQPTVALEGDGAQVVFQRQVAEDEQFKLQASGGVIQGTWTAVRTNRPKAHAARV